jgi:hypothetical protein
MKMGTFLFKKASFFPVKDLYESKQRGAGEDSPENPQRCILIPKFSVSGVQLFVVSN